MHSRLRTTLTRIIVPALLAICVTAVIMRGGNALPTWLANAAVRTGLGVDTAVKLLVAAMITCAAFGVVLPWAAPFLAWVTLAAMAFVALAELSALFNAPGDGVLPVLAWLIPGIALVVGAAGMWAMSATAPPRGDGAAAGTSSAKNAGGAPAARRVTAWHAMLGLLIAVVAMGVAARLTVLPRDARHGTGGVPFVDLDAANWVGKTIPATGLALRIPELTPLTLEETKWIVFYQPSCGRCHEVFRTYFEGDQEHTVIAIEVPHAPGATVLPSDQPEEIECTNCVQLALPAGTHWAITTPTIVKVENGVVTCVTSHDYHRCRTPSEITANEQK